MAARFWVTGGTGNWSSTTNWSATSGGGSGASVPGSADTATFNASSGAGTATVDSNVTIQTLTMTGFTGTLAFGVNTISVNSTGTVYTGAATFAVTGTPVIIVTNATATATTVTAGAVTEANSISFKFTGGTYALTFLGTASHAAKNVDFTGFGGTWNARTVASTIYGSLTLSTGMTFNASSGVLTFGATSGTQIITTNAKTVDEPLTINGVGGTVQLADALTLGATRALTLTNGTFDGNSKTISGASTFSMVTGSVTIKNISTALAFTLTSGALIQGAANTFGAFTWTLGNLDINNYQLNCSSFTTTGVAARTLAFGTGNITCVNAAGGTLFTTSTVASALIVTGTSTINISNNSANAATVTPGSTPEANSLSFNFIDGTYALTFMGNTNEAAKNVNFSGFAGTWSRGGLTKIYGNLTFSSAAGFSAAASANSLTFGATSGTQIITSNAKTHDYPITLNGVGGTVQLADALLMGTTRILNHTNGTLDLNGKTLTVGTQYQTATGTKVLTFNGGTLVCPASSAQAFNNASPTNFTTTAGTGTGKISMTSASSKTFVGGGSTYNCTLSQDGTGTLTISGNNTFTTIANGTYPTTILFTAGTTTTVSNFNIVGGTTYPTQNVTIGSTSTTNFTLSKSSGIVFAKFITLSRSTATGGASWYANIGSTDGGNNSGWLFGAPKWWVGGTGNWSNAGNWSATQGGVGGVNIFYPDTATFDGTSGTGTCTLDVNPTIQALSLNASSVLLAFGTNNISLAGIDTVFLGSASPGSPVSGTPVINVISTGSDPITISPSNPIEQYTISFNFTGGTYALTFPAASRVRSLNFTGFSGSIVGGSNSLSVYGDLTLSATAALDFSAGNLSFPSTSATTRVITTNGVTIDRPLNFSGSGGSWRLADALTMGSIRQLIHSNGTLDLNGKILTVGTAYTTASGTKNLTFNGGELRCPAATATAFNNAAPTNFSTTAGTGTGKITMTAATAKTFVGGSSTYNCTLSNDGAGALTITGSNTFTSIANGTQPTTFTFTAATTQTITNWNISGTAGNLVTINSSTAAVPALLSKASGTVSADYLSIQDSTALGGAAWYAGANSTNVSGNLGWIFSAPPVVTAGGNFFFMF